MNKTALEAVRPLDEILSSNLPALLSPEEKLIWLLGDLMNAVENYFGHENPKRLGHINSSAIRILDEIVQPLRDELAGHERALAAMMLRQSLATGRGDTFDDLLRELEWQIAERRSPAPAPAEGVTDELAGNIAYALTRRLVIDMPTARAAVDEAMSSAALLPSQSAEKAGVVGCHGLDTPERVCFYEQDFYVLSNFSSFMIAWDDKVFPTSEHVYHWEKFNTRRSDIAAEIRVAISAHEAFKIAERNKHLRRRNWDDVKVDIMRDILRAKAAQHEYVRRKLLATGNRELVENSWRDDFWGWGPNRDGKNMLGKLWMEVRAELRASPSPATGEEA